MGLRVKNSSIAKIVSGFFMVSAACADAGGVDIPEDWWPHINAEYIDQIVKPVFTNKEGFMTDYDMVQYGTMMRSVWDAKLLGTYIVLARVLLPGDAAALKEEQVKWMALREKESIKAGAVEGGGTLETFQQAMKYCEMTKAREEKLQEIRFAHRCGQSFSMSMQKAFWWGMAALLLIVAMSRCGNPDHSKIAIRELREAGVIPRESTAEMIYDTRRWRENHYIIVLSERPVLRGRTAIPLDFPEVDVADRILGKKGLSIEKLKAERLFRSEGEDGADLYWPETKGPPYYLVVLYL